MKAMKLVAVSIFAAMALAIAGPAGAGGVNGSGPGNGAGHATSARSPSHSANRAGTGYRAGMRQRNRGFPGAYQNSPYYPYGNSFFGNPFFGNPYFGNEIVENPDEADWAEQWGSLYEDNDGPYARSTRENPPGEARMWEFPEK
ncbi:hypothetical protein [Candidatus Binatus sp.]|uniref:hypothetical protein n=1 Tax=Candidatus Binatus sp. TaxID=2811406 RepID=UPI002F9341EE